MSKPLTIEPTGRLQKLPPYLFAEIDKKKRELIAKGKDVIDLGSGIRTFQRQISLSRP